MTLEISEGGSRTMSGSLDDDLESITRAIEGMFVLKKLTIRARLEASFRIRSSEWDNSIFYPMKSIFYPNMN